MAGPNGQPETPNEYSQERTDLSIDVKAKMDEKRAERSKQGTESAELISLRQQQIKAFEEGAGEWPGMEKARNKTVSSVSKRLGKIRNTITGPLDPNRHDSLDHYISKITTLTSVAIDNVARQYYKEISISDDPIAVTERYIKDVQQISVGMAKYVDRLADVLGSEDAEVIAEISDQIVSIASLVENRSPELESVGLRRAFLRRTAHIAHPDDKEKGVTADDNPVKVKEDLESFAQAYVSYRDQSADVVMMALKVLPEEQKRQFIDLYMQELEKSIKSRPDTPADVSQAKIDQAVTKKTLSLLMKAGSKEFTTFTPKQVSTFAREFLGLELSAEQKSELLTAEELHEKKYKTMADKMRRVEYTNPLHSYLSLSNMTSFAAQVWGAVTAGANIYVNFANAYRNGEGGFLSKTLLGAKNSVMNPWTIAGGATAYGIHKLRNKSNPSKSQEKMRDLNRIYDFGRKHPEMSDPQSAASLGTFYQRAGQFVAVDRMVPSAIQFLKERISDSGVSAAERSNLPRLIASLEAQLNADGTTKGLDPEEFADYCQSLYDSNVKGLEGDKRFIRDVLPYIKNKS